MDEQTGETMFRELTEKEQRFYDECKIRGLKPFYNKMVQHSLTKEWTNYAPNTINKKSKKLNMKEFKTEIISLLEQYSQALPVTEFTDDEQWYLAVEIGATDSALIAAQSLIQDNLEGFRLGDISPYSYKGDMGSPILLYKAKNNQGFGLLNSYLVAGEALDDTYEPNPSVKELLRLTGRLRRSQAHEPSSKKLDFYINVTIPVETLMLENLALAGTEINYVEEEYDGVYYFKNSEIGAAWQEVPESIYLMYALGKNPSPQFHSNIDWFAKFSINPRSLNYPGGL